MLCMEWGITWQEYLNTPFDIIGKIKRYKQAEAHGQQRLNQKNKV